MKKNYDQFIGFVRTFSESNYFEFIEADVKKVVREHNEYFYDATYRDGSNYKSNVLFSFNEVSGEILWQVDDKWSNAVKDISTLYTSYFYAIDRDKSPMDNPDTTRIHNVLEKLLDQIHKVKLGEISMEEVFNGIPLRECLPRYTIMPTTWHIDDLREYFPDTTSDEELYGHLLELERGIRDNSIIAGRDVIEMYVDDLKNS